VVLGVLLSVHTPLFSRCSMKNMITVPEMSQGCAVHVRVKSRNLATTLRDHVLTSPCPFVADVLGVGVCRMLSGSTVPKHPLDAGS
jgi:hypothetical protein